MSRARVLLILGPYLPNEIKMIILRYFPSEQIIYFAKLYKFDRKKLSKYVHIDYVSDIQDIVYKNNTITPKHFKIYYEKFGKSPPGTYFIDGCDQQIEDVYRNNGVAGLLDKYNNWNWKEISLQAKLSDEDLKREQIDKYKLLDILGEGSYGIVYHAKH